MRTRTLSLLIAGTFLFGTAAACSDDDDPADSDTTTTESEDEDEGGGGEGANADVEAYCDDIDALAAAIEEADGDPAAFAEFSPQLADVQASGAELAQNAADFNEEDGERLQECTEVLTDAAASLTGG